MPHMLCTSLMKLRVSQAFINEDGDDAPPLAAIDEEPIGLDCAAPDSLFTPTDVKAAIVAFV